MQIPCVYLPGPAPAVTVANTSSQTHVDNYFCQTNWDKFASAPDILGRVVLSSVADGGNLQHNMGPHVL